MKKTWILPIVFGGIGLLMLIITFFIIASEEKFIKNAKVADGKVIRLEYHSSKNGGGYHPVVEFSYNGQIAMFTSSVGSSPASYNQGDNVQVLFDPTNLRSAQIKDFTSEWLLPLILGGIGLLFFSIAAGIGFVAIKNQKKMERLLNTGKKIESDFESVQLNLNYKVNNRSPYKIYSRWVDKSTNTVYNFASDNIWFNPEPYIQNGKVPVYIDSLNPKEYYVDISFLPKEGN